MLENQIGLDVMPGERIHLDRITIRQAISPAVRPGVPS